MGGWGADDRARGRELWQEEYHFSVNIIDIL